MPQPFRLLHEPLLTYDFSDAAACQEKDRCKYRCYRGKVSRQVVGFHRLDLLIFTASSSSVGLSVF
jgi:hypothetical protein